ncbi:hypothetical protein As57867_011219, partial [Aphanomyces stellatus]
MGNAVTAIQKEKEYVAKMNGFLNDPTKFMIDSRDTFGDVFLIESSLVNQKVAGLTGPEALAQFEARFADGTLVKAGALPPGIADLLGPVLSTIDGDVHARRKAAVLKAFTLPQLAKYAPVIRHIVQSEHSRWAARGGTISLACMTKELVFKVVLAVLYGLEGEFDEYRTMVSDFVDSIRVSATKASADGKDARESFTQAILAPAIKQSKDRVASGQAISCVLDCWVEWKELSDDELNIEGFNHMFAGVGGLSGLATNLITPLVTLPAIRANVFAARDAFLTKYGDDRWNHLDDLGYINQYILEVKRLFVAGPTQVYGKATTDFDVVTSKGTFHIPKGTIVSAGLETTNRDGDTWSNPDEFNPDRFADFELSQNLYKFCPHGVGHTTQRRCPAEQLVTLVCQSVLLSYFDFTWNMVPGQNFAVQDKSVTPVPVDGLTIVGFTRRADSSSYGTAGSEGDWKFLNLPEAKTLVGKHEGGLFSDPRLDLWTQLMIKQIGKKQMKWDRPFADSALTIPTQFVPLEKLTLAQTSIQIPIVDEDWPSAPWLEVKNSNFLRDNAPFVDDFKHKFLPGEDGERYVLSKVGHMWPRVNVHWNDRYSDRAIELIAFNGLGSHMVEKLPAEQPDGSYYGILLNFMQVLEVRPGFAKYGADAFFDKQGKLLKIQRGDNT